MKKIIVIICMTVFVMGCGNNPIKCYNAVQEKYSNEEVITLPGNRYQFLVRIPNGEIRFVRTFNAFSTKITEDVRVFTAKNPIDK